MDLTQELLGEISVAYIKQKAQVADINPLLASNPVASLNSCNECLGNM